MAQVLEFKLPDLGEGLTEAEIVRWLVEVGEVVAVDQPVVEVETAKAMVEVPCPYGGVVTARFGEEGAELPVGAPLLTVAVGEPSGASGASGAPESAGASSSHGASGSFEPAGASPPAGTAGSAGSAGHALDGSGGGEAAGSGNVLVGYGTGAPAARRRRVRPAAPGTATVPGTAIAPGTASAPGTALAPGTAIAPGTATAPTPATAPSAPGADWAVRPVASGTGSRLATAPSAGARAAASAAAPDASVRDGLPADGGPVPVISPLVRRLARVNGVDLRRLLGSGPEGLILRADVENALRAGTAPHGAGTAASTHTGFAASAPADPAPLSANQAASPSATWPTASAAASPRAAGTAPTPGADTRVPLKGIRGAVADKLSRSRREIPDATCWVDADATELMRARAAMQHFTGGRPQTPGAAAPKISVLALLARICTAALARHPELNSTVDTEAREVVLRDQVHLGFAAQTARGLVVPVVRDAHTLNAEALSAEFARLTEAAHAGALTPADLTGGTFTLNNYGVFGVDGSTPIINHPEAAMLGVGRITPKPWVHEGELAVRQVVQLSLTFDHRVCDGGTAGGFLRYVADCVEQPAVLLRSL
ncbi:dihydrolipoamide acetyltransferase family protein [Streptomyces sp. NPDC046985]|uniref:dihydrolipoamide acetyltransferase family protein n=1 Tax=Streptomyces sp. NPDC046985 TaxID=3155377 RepID=UPI0033CFA08B